MYYTGYNVVKKKRTIKAKSSGVMVLEYYPLPQDFKKVLHSRYMFFLVDGSHFASLRSWHLHI